MASWDLSGCMGHQMGVSQADGVPTIKCLEPLFQNVVQSLVAFIGVTFFVMLIIGGYNFLFSAGDQKKLQQAKGTITMAIAGIFIITCAYLVIRIIESFTGINTLHLFSTEVPELPP